MSEILERFKPGIPRRMLCIIAGTMWCCVGIMLTSMAFRWLKNFDGNVWPFITAGLIAALIIHHFGFLKIVDKNLGRIAHLSSKPCAFSFISWKSYITIIIMVAMGLILRHSSLPKEFLSIIYLGIGFALILSSIRYFRYEASQKRRDIN